MYIPKPRMALKLKFRLRTGQTTGDKPRQLYIRISVDNTYAKSDYASGIMVRPDKWDVGRQRLLGNSKLAKETNDELENVVADHKNLLADLVRLHKAGIISQKPDAELVRQHWTQKSSLLPTLLDAYDEHLSYLHALAGTPDAREPRTLEKWDNGRLYLAQYIADVGAQKLTCDLVTPKWAEGWYHALIRRPLGLASAARFIGYLRASIGHLVALGKLSVNPLASYFPDKGKDKPIYALEQHHIDVLWRLEALDDTQALVRDWLLLMIYTGMDQPDLERYVASPEKYREETPDGPVIHVPRGKTKLVATIPLLDEVGQIMALYPAGMRTLSNQTINMETRLIQRLIGFEHRLTTKICRKTATHVFAGRGFAIHEVSKILGHASLQTTLRNYFKPTGETVKQGMKRIGQQVNS